MLELDIIIPKLQNVLNALKPHLSETAFRQREIGLQYMHKDPLETAEVVSDWLKGIAGDIQRSNSNYNISSYFAVMSLFYLEGVEGMVAEEVRNLAIACDRLPANRTLEYVEGAGAAAADDPDPALFGGEGYFGGSDQLVE